MNNRGCTHLPPHPLTPLSKGAPTPASAHLHPRYVVQAPSPFTQVIATAFSTASAPFPGRSPSTWPSEWDIKNTDRVTSYPWQKPSRAFHSLKSKLLSPCRALRLSWVLGHRASLLPPPPGHALKVVQWAKLVSTHAAVPSPEHRSPHHSSPWLTRPPQSILSTQGGGRFLRGPSPPLSKCCPSVLLPCNCPVTALTALGGN